MAAHLRCDRPLLGLSLAFSPALTALGKPPWHSVQAIAATYAATIQAVQPQGPYYLMGYSFGGIVAYEVAQQLQAQGQTVAQVILLDTSIAPTAVALPWPERWLVRWRLYWHQRRVWRQPWPVRWRRYVERAQRWANRVMVCLGPQDPAIMPATGDAMGDRPVGTFTSEGIRLEDHSWALARHYVAQPYQGAIVLIRAQRPMNSLRDYNLHRDSTLGWGPVAGPNLEIRTVLGDHVSMLRPNHAAALAAVLDDYLDVPTSLS
jgi:thioesterase domain-containing protein